jgi:hypothetical protein
VKRTGVITGRGKAPKPATPEDADDGWNPGELPF